MCLGDDAVPDAADVLLLELVGVLECGVAGGLLVGAEGGVGGAEPLGEEQVLFEAFIVGVAEYEVALAVFVFFDEVAELGEIPVEDGVELSQLLAAHRFTKADVDPLRHHDAPPVHVQCRLQVVHALLVRNLFEQQDLVVFRGYLLKKEIFQKAGLHFHSLSPFINFHPDAVLTPVHLLLAGHIIGLLVRLNYHYVRI